MRIIIAGMGKVGATLARHLSSEGYDLTLVDSNNEVLEKMMEQCDAMAANGNCATMATMKQSGIEKADLLIAMAGADEVNLLCCMTAHTMNPNIHTIARIRNPEYYEQIYVMRNAFGLSMCVNPEKQTAAKIERLLKFPGFLKQDSFARDRVEIVELKVEEGGPLEDVSLQELNMIIKCQILVCVVERDKDVIMPGGHFILRKNDHIWVTAATNELAVLLENVGVAIRKVKKVILAGGGRISYYLAKRLLGSGISVEIIEKDYNRCLELAGHLPAADIIHGDATNHSTLDREGISECDALVSLTGYDEMNIVISLYGTNDKVPQVVTKLAHKENSDILNQLPIGSITCPRELCCNTIIRYVRAMRNQTGSAVSIHSIARGKAEAVEFRVDENTKHCKTPLRELSLKRNVLIACISRRGQTQIPNGDSQYQIGDTVVVVTRADTILMQLNDIFE